MSHDTLTMLTQLLHSVAEPGEVRQRARKLGVVVRQGKVDAYALLVTTALAVAHRGPQSLAAIRRSFITGLRISLHRSSFFDRFTPAFRELMKGLLDALVDKAQPISIRPYGALAGFRDIIAIDSTVVKVHDSLAKRWKGTRTNSGKAAIKVHTWIRALSGEIVKYKVTREAYGDSRAFGVSGSVKGVLFLLDMGYSSPSLWWKIHRLGGYFLTRLPADRDPSITRNHRRHRGRSRSSVGRKLRDLLRGLQRKYLDVGASFRVKIRPYGDSPGREEDVEFRVVGVRHPVTGKYHLFVTNAPPTLLPAEVTRNTYRLRWEVELLFKAAKSHSGLPELPSSKEHIMLTLAYAALIRVTAAMQALAKVRRHAPLGRWINPVQWMTWWNEWLDPMLLELLRPLARCTPTSLEELALLTMDPNLGRTPNRHAFSCWQEATV